MMQRGRGSKIILWKVSSRDSSFSGEKLSNFKFLKEMLQQRVDGGWNQTKQNQSYRTKDWGPGSVFGNILQQCWDGCGCERLGSSSERGTVLALEKKHKTPCTGRRLKKTAFFCTFAKGCGPRVCCILVICHCECDLSGPGAWHSFENLNQNET